MPLLLALAGCSWSLSMPGESWHGDAPPAPDADVIALQRSLRRTVEALAGTVGIRNVRHAQAFLDARRFIEVELAAAGLAVEGQSFTTEGVETANLIVTIAGGAAAKEIVVVGAHYDTAAHTPGADDNASGVAAVLELARLAARRPLMRTLRFVLFTNEEPPYFQTEKMGSLVYARACRQRGDNVSAALSIESVGVFSDAPSADRHAREAGLRSIGPRRPRSRRRDRRPGGSIAQTGGPRADWLRSIRRISWGGPKRERKLVAFPP